MKIWVVKDEKGRIKGSSLTKREYAWHPIYKNIPIDSMAKALESIGWTCTEHDIPTLEETLEEGKDGT